MKTTQLLLPTFKETPADAEIISHQLMLRGAMIRKLAAGLYTWLPLGLRVLRKVENIVREEMDRAGAQEVLMPAIQPSELWQESGRWDIYGPELLRLKDRHQRDFCFGPTHEEVITAMARKDIHSYKQLPKIFYQIQTKFRDEIRPRFGVMRAREFIMKDAYSFHADDACLQQTYDKMYATYERIFTRLGLNFRAVEADSGAIGGAVSHEFHVLADAGEDAIVFSPSGAYASNIEQAPCAKTGTRSPASADMQTVATPNQRNIAEVSDLLKVNPAQCLKTLLVQGVDDHPVVALVLRGDHQLNTTKAGKHPLVATPLCLVDEKTIAATVSCEAGFIGPVNLNIPIICDHSAAQLHDFICGANKNGYHLRGVNWGRDLTEPESVDIRNITANEPSPDGSGPLSIARGIEVGHIFQLGRKYSQAMKAEILDQQGKSTAMTMGCYGIGISRIVAAAIEQNHDEYGICWPAAMAPYQVALLPLKMHKSQRVRDAAEKIYQDFCAAGIEILLDDRKERPGILFADMDLIGIPHRLVLTEKGLDQGTIEYKARNSPDKTDLNLQHLIATIKQKL